LSLSLLFKPLFPCPRKRRVPLHPPRRFVTMPQLVLNRFISGSLVLFHLGLGTPSYFQDFHPFYYFKYLLLPLSFVNLFLLRTKVFFEPQFRSTPLTVVGALLIHLFPFSSLIFPSIVSSYSVIISFSPFISHSCGPAQSILELNNNRVLPPC